MPSATWRVQIESLGLPWPNGPLELELDGKRVAVFHGHERGFRPVLAAAEHDYLLHGHSHSREDYRQNGMRVINPGALQRATAYTVALLDLETDELASLRI
jgi:predicted phosphodiesterase